MKILLKLWLFTGNGFTMKSIVAGFIMSSLTGSFNNLNPSGITQKNLIMEEESSVQSGSGKTIHWKYEDMKMIEKGKLNIDQKSKLPGSIFLSLKDLYTGKQEFGLISFKDGLEITFSGSAGEITLQHIRKVFEENKDMLRARYGTTVLEELKNKVSFIAHSHPQNSRPTKRISFISPPKAIGPSFTASEADFDFTKKIGIRHYVIDQTTIVLIDENGNFVNSWFWRDDGTVTI